MACNTRPDQALRCDQVRNERQYPRLKNRAIGLKADGVFLATGQNFPDALAAGPVAAKRGAALLLVDPGIQIASETFRQYASSISNAYIVGGTAVIPENDAQTLAKALGLNVL